VTINKTVHVARQPQNAVPFVHLRRALARLIFRRVLSNDYNFSRLVDFYARDMHTGRGHGLNGLSHVLLPKCGWCAGHKLKVQLALFHCAVGHPSGGELHSPLAASSSSTASKSDVSLLPDWGCKTASLASLASWPCPLFLLAFLPDGDACDARDAVLPCCSGAARPSMWIVRVWPVRSKAM